MKNATIYWNKKFTKRDHDCTNIVACVVEDGAAPKLADYFVPCANQAALGGLTMLHVCAGVKYYGYL